MNSADEAAIDQFKNDLQDMSLDEITREINEVTERLSLDESWLEALTAMQSKMRADGRPQDSDNFDPAGWEAEMEKRSQAIVPEDRKGGT